MNPSGAFWSSVREWKNWSVFAIVVLLVAIVGLPHYYRILATYGTLLRELIHQAGTGGRQFSTYMGLILRRRPWKMALFLVCIFPVLLVFFSSLPYRIIALGLKKCSWAPVPLALFLYLLLAEFLFSYQQISLFRCGNTVSLSWHSLPFESLIHTCPRTAIWPGFGEPVL